MSGLQFVMSRVRGLHNQADGSGDAVCTGLGKREMTIIAVGTLAPAPLTGPASWWPATVAAGSGNATHVALLQADPDRWESFDEVLRVNPVAAVNPHLRRALEREHKSALESDRAARTFRQFRLNIPGEKVDSQPLITSAEWERICTKPIPGDLREASYRIRSRWNAQLERRVCALAVGSN